MKFTIHILWYAPKWESKQCADKFFCRGQLGFKKQIVLLQVCSFYCLILILHLFLEWWVYWISHEGFSRLGTYLAYLGTVYFENFWLSLLISLRSLSIVETLDILSERCLLHRIYKNGHIALLNSYLLIFKERWERCLWNSREKEGSVLQGRATGLW